MEELRLSDIPENTKQIVEPFFMDIISHSRENINSLYLIGSVVTTDYNIKYSDINTLIVVKQIEIPFFDFVATLGKRYGKKKVRAPIIITRDYIHRTLDVFPLEFLDMKLMHRLVYGDDVFHDIQLKKNDVRLQCERELKGKLENLCQCYIKAMGNKTVLAESFYRALSGYFPLFRGVLFLYDENMPGEKREVLRALKERCGIEIHAFEKLLDFRTKCVYPSLQELKEIFADLYRELDVIVKKVDEYKIRHE